jgi:hypothetical protein
MNMNIQAQKIGALQMDLKTQNCGFVENNSEFS